MNNYCYTTWSWAGGPTAYASVFLSPSSSCTVTRTVLHEILHALVFYHTHKRHDRDQYINVHWENVYPGNENEFEKCSGCCCDTWDVPYDCDSIMHYATDQMSKNWGDTIC